jgi:hypothetical protein
MKIKLALITLLIPTAVFAQAGKSSENAGYQGTTSATQGLGASNPNAGGVGTVPPSTVGAGKSRAQQPVGTVPPSTVGGNRIPPSQIQGGATQFQGGATDPIVVDPRPIR